MEGVESGEAASLPDPRVLSRLGRGCGCGLAQGQGLLRAEGWGSAVDGPWPSSSIQSLSCVKWEAEHVRRKELAMYRWLESPLRACSGCCVDVSPPGLEGEGRVGGVDTEVGSTGNGGVLLQSGQGKGTVVRGEQAVEVLYFCDCYLGTRLLRQVDRQAGMIPQGGRMDEAEEKEQWG